MPSLETFFTEIEDGKTVRLDLPLLGEQEKKRVYGIYQAREGVDFFLAFPAGILPGDRIDRSRDCGVLVDLGGRHVSICARITDIPDLQTLALKGCQLISHDQLRNYFRVDVCTPIVAASLVPEELATDEDDWRLCGETLDVSGSGILAVFARALDPGLNVRVNLVLPTTDRRVVHAVGRVVRCKQIKDDQHRIALHFDQIEPKDRDRIMACCFQIQRQQLRLKVQLENS